YPHLALLSNRIILNTNISRSIFRALNERETKMFTLQTNRSDRQRLANAVVFRPKALTLALLGALALTVSTSSLLPVWAGPGDTNSVHTSQDVAGGTYYNTSGSRTEFRNNSGMVISNGTVVRGLEVNGGGATTGNGGRVHFDAGSGVLRVDGGINVNALMSG